MGEPRDAGSTPGGDRDNRSEPQPFRTRQVVAIAGAHCFHDIFGSFLAPLLPLLIAKHRLSLTLAGSLALVQRLPSLLNPLVGIVADRYPLRWFVVLGPALTAASMSLIGLPSSYSTLVALLLVAGVSIALFHVPAPVMVTLVSGDRVGRGMSFFMVGGELARTLAPIIALAAVSAWRLEGSYHLLPSAAVCAIVLHLTIADVGRRSSRGGPRSLRRTWREMRRVLLLLGGMLVARSFMVGAMTTFLPALLTARDDGLWFAGISLSVLEAAGTVGTFAGGSLSDRIGRRRVILASLLLSPLFLFLFLPLRGWLIMPVLLLIGVTAFAINPVMLSVVQDHADESDRATANGIYLTLNFVIRSAMVLAVGAMGDQLGLERTFLVAGVLGLVGIPFALALPEPR